MPKSIRTLALLGMAGTLLSACGGDKEDRSIASLDAELVNNSVDPALREAVEAPIASDPDLAGEANRDAVRPSDKPLNGALPLLSPRETQAQALKLAGGKLIHTPAVTRTVTSTREPVTLGGLAARQQGRDCPPARISYAMQWAQRLPADLPIYPGAQLTEAAGADNRPCALRAASFVTGAAEGEVMDFYATMARRGGYTVEHVEENGGHVLSGTRDRDAGTYHIRFDSAPDSDMTVRLIVHSGR